MLLSYRIFNLEATASSKTGPVNPTTIPKFSHSGLERGRTSVDANWLLTLTGFTSLSPRIKFYELIFIGGDKRLD